jgi:hypothetical protein
MAKAGCLFFLGLDGEFSVSHLQGGGEPNSNMAAVDGVAGKGLSESTLSYELEWRRRSGKREKSQYRGFEAWPRS